MGAGARLPVESFDVRRHLEVLQWARENGCSWFKWECERRALHHPDTLAWIRQQPSQGDDSDTLPLPSSSSSDNDD